MTVKKVTLVLSVLVIVMALVAGAFGCAKSAPAGAKPSPKAGWPTSVAIGSRPPGANTYPLSVAWAKLIEKYVGVEAHAMPVTTASVFPGLLQSGDMQFATSNMPTMAMAYRGQSAWTGAKQVKGVRGLIHGESAVFMIFCRPDVAMQSWADLKGKRWIARLPGSDSVDMAIACALHVYDLTEKDLKIVPQTGPAEIGDALRQRTADAGSYWCQPGTAFVQELDRQNELKFIYHTSDEHIAKAIKLSQGWFTKCTMFARYYRNLGNKDYVSYGFYESAVTHASLPDDFIYEVMKAWGDHFDEMVEMYPGAAYYKIPECLDPDHWSIPSHAGAVKYFKEKGYWTPAHEAKQAALLKEVGETK